MLREQITESLVLSAIGGGIGVGLAYASVTWLVRWRHDIPRTESTHMDALVLAFAAGIALLSGVAIGFMPALGRGGDILEGLQESSRSHSSGQSRARLRRLLLASEVGLTVMLLIAAGLLLKSYNRLRSSDLGCITENVLTLRVSLPKPRYANPVRLVDFFQRLIGGVRHLPGVQQAGMASAIPGQGYTSDTLFTIAERPAPSSGQSQIALKRFADPGYFSAMQIPILRGRSFSEAERLDRASSVVASDLFARMFFPNEDPVGKHLRVSLTDNQGVYEIVGVVGDTRFQISRPPEPMLYFPQYSGLSGRMTLVVRSQQDPSGLALPIQKLVAQLDPELPVSDVLTMEQLVGGTTVDAGFSAGLVLTFALLSLLLAAVGLYGVLSYLVTQRRAEIGVRMALGARRGEVLRLVLADGLRPACFGLVAGLAGGAAATRLIRSLLYDVRPLDQGVFTVVALLLGLVAVAACILPAWQASRLDPMEALRSE